MFAFFLYFEGKTQPENKEFRGLKAPKKGGFRHGIFWAKSLCLGVFFGPEPNHSEFQLVSVMNFKECLEHGRETSKTTPEPSADQPCPSFPLTNCFLDEGDANMPQAKTEVLLQLSESCAAEEGRGTRNGYEASKGSNSRGSNRGSKGSRKTPKALRGLGPCSGAPSPSFKVVLQKLHCNTRFSAKRTSLF